MSSEVQVEDPALARLAQEIELFKRLERRASQEAQYWLRIRCAHQVALYRRERELRRMTRVEED